MERLRVRQLVWLIVVVTTLLAAMTALSELRLRRLRAEIDAIQSESAELSSKNRLLRNRVESEVELRARLRSHGVRLTLEAVEPDSPARATIYIDRAKRRALAVIDNLSLTPDTEMRWALVLDSNSGRTAIPLDVGAFGSVELLLTDLPVDTREFVVAYDTGSGFATVLSGAGVDATETP